MWKWFLIQKTHKLSDDNLSPTFFSKTTFQNFFAGWEKKKIWKTTKWSLFLYLTPINFFFLLIFLALIYQNQKRWKKNWHEFGKELPAISTTSVFGWKTNFSLLVKKKLQSQQNFKNSTKEQSVLSSTVHSLRKLMKIFFTFIYPTLT